MMTSPDFDMYPDEEIRVRFAMHRLSSAFDFTEGFRDAQKVEFEDAAHTEMAKIGIEVRINWKQILRKNPLGFAEPTGVWLAGVEPIGRTRKESGTDHDRYQWGVVKGLADGQAGYVRESGEKREDPISKIILP